MYGPNEQSATVFGHTLSVTRFCTIRGLIQSGLSRNKFFHVVRIDPPSHEKGFYILSRETTLQLRYVVDEHLVAVLESYEANRDHRLRPAGTPVVTACQTGIPVVTASVRTLVP